MAAAIRTDCPFGGFPDRGLFFCISMHFPLPGLPMTPVSRLPCVELSDRGFNKWPKHGALNMHLSVRADARGLEAKPPRLRADVHLNYHD